MKQPELDAHAKALADIADDFKRHAFDAIEVAVDRAHAHGVVALTETLKRRPDGRATLRHAKQSRSYLAALRDLTDLTNTLAGASVTSLDGIIRECREAVYRKALVSWVNLYPVEFSVGSDPKITQARMVDVRGLVLHGMELRTEILGRVDQCKDALLPMIEQASRKAITDPEQADFLGGWKQRSIDMLNLAAGMAIQDSVIAIDGIASVDAVKPELRPAGPFAPT